PVGVQALTTLAHELYDAADPLAPAAGEGPFRVARGRGSTVVHLALPGVDEWMSKDDVHLGRNGDELVVTVGSYRRLLTLPAGLARRRVAGARVEQGELQVRFVEPDRPRRPGPSDEERR